MPNKAVPHTQKVRNLAKDKDDLVNEGVALYLVELEKPNKSGLSSRAIATMLKERYLKETGHHIKLSHTLLLERSKGRRSQLEYAADREILHEEEKEVVIQYLIACADQGFPLTHTRLKEVIDTILKARLGDGFPGVGQKYTHRFLERCSDRIKVSRSTPLESKRANAVNEHTNDAWWELLKYTQEKYNIKPEHTYAVDEAGIQAYSGDREYVIGPNRKGPQYQRRGGTKENITIMVSICGDGTAQPPAFIFKGKGYQVKWAQNNPVNASIGYSEKGWTDNEIGVDWLKLFDKQTVAKANGEYRLLLVDGHASHYSYEFLKYAREHKIVVLCYPSHATHIYQGLDVVIFSVLKLRLSQERDKWTRKHIGEIRKENILEIYGNAHLATLTPENIKAAFRKTGVIPFDPTVVTPAMMAPSRPTSIQSNLPAPPPTPMRIVTKLLEELSQEDDAALATINEDDNSDTPPSPSDAQMARRRQIIQEGARQLAKTNFSHLVGKAPTTSTSPMPRVAPEIIPTSAPSTVAELLNMVPTTANEALLIAAIQELEAEHERLRGRVIQMQAASILNEAHCNMLRFQLLQKEEKAKKKKGKGKLMGDGLPRLLTGDEFFQRVVEFTEWQEEKEARGLARVDAKVAWQAAVKEWEAKEVIRKEENKAISEAHKQNIARWEHEKAAAKRVKKPFTTQRPKRPTLLKQPSKPKLKDFEVQSDDEDALEEVGSGLEVDNSEGEEDEDED